MSPIAVKNLRQRFMTLLLALATLLLTGCSRTVTWQEEVPLNTGETIWVTREVRYEMQGAGGNPMDLGMRPLWKESLSFSWKGKQYSYTGTADIMLVAISPETNLPVLVANAMMKGWYRENKYACVKPFYVQFNPDSTGNGWTWPPAIEPWLYDQPYNVMYHKPESEQAKKRYTAEERTKLDWGLGSQQKYLVRVVPDFSIETCNHTKG